ncbi:MAG TPA: hypothetical protein VGC46_11300 [Allosphingosinicella sp.]
MTVLGIAVATAAAFLQPGQPRPGQTVVVTGTRISDLEDALNACLARSCPPNEDVDATLALAEGRFLDGDYAKALEDITQSLRRNRRHGAQFPEPVSDLYRAQARVQWHRGRDNHAKIATRRILEVLREGLPQEDHRHFTARLEGVEMLLRIGDFGGARSELAELAERASAAGRDDVRRLADMRRLRVDYFLDRRRTMARLEQLARATNPGQRFEMISSRLLLAAIHRLEGNEARSDALLASIPTGPRRELLFSPPFLADVREHAQNGPVPTRVATEFRNAWIDVGYWIGADGRVADVEVVRHGTNPSWAEPLVRAIRGRIFSRSTDGQASYRLERYTFTAPLELDGNTRAGLRRNVERARVEFMDLTTDEEPGGAPPVPIAPGQASPSPPSAS